MEHNLEIEQEKTHWKGINEKLFSMKDEWVVKQYFSLMPIIPILEPIPTNWLKTIE